MLQLSGDVMENVHVQQQWDHHFPHQLGQFPLWPIGQQNLQWDHQFLGLGQKVKKQRNPFTISLSHPL